MELTFKRPDPIVEIPASERADKCKESDDLCAIWGPAECEHRYFIRGILPLPVRERASPYGLGVWVEVPKQSFDKVRDLWDSADQGNEPPFPGTLANMIPFQKATLGLGVNVHLTGPKTRPSFQVTDDSHMLHWEQLHGISSHQAHAYTSLVI